MRRQPVCSFSAVLLVEQIGPCFIYILDTIGIDATSRMCSLVQDSVNAAKVLVCSSKVATSCSMLNVGVNTLEIITLALRITRLYRRLTQNIHALWNPSFYQLEPSSFNFEIRDQA